MELGLGEPPNPSTKSSNFPEVIKTACQRQRLEIVEMMENGGAFGCLFRRKPVDAARQKPATQQLARKLSLFDLTAIGTHIFILLNLNFVDVPFAIAHRESEQVTKHYSTMSRVQPVEKAA